MNKVSSIAIIATFALFPIANAWAVSGYPPQNLSTAGGTPGYPDAIRFSTSDDPTTYYCVSSEDPAGNAVSSMIADALELFSYNIGDNMNLTFHVGTPSGGWAHPSDCPSNYSYGVGLSTTIPSPISGQALTMKIAGSAHPSCIEFTLQGTSGLFGASLNDTNGLQYLAKLATSEYLGNDVTYSLGGSNSSDCDSTDTYVSNVATN